MSEIGRFEAHEIRRLFPSWSIAVPFSFDETFVDDEPGVPYWHGFDEHRSISMTSWAVDDNGRPVSANEILPVFPLDMGEPIDEVPEGLLGRAVIADADASARAGKLLSGIVAVDGRVLLVTITADNLDWSRMIWQTIQFWPADAPLYASRQQRRDAKMRGRCAQRSRSTRTSRRAS